MNIEITALYIVICYQLLRSWLSSRMIRRSMSGPSASSLTSC